MPGRNFSNSRTALRLPAPGMVLTTILPSFLAASTHCCHSAGMAGAAAGAGAATWAGALVSAGFAGALAGGVAELAPGGGFEPPHAAMSGMMLATPSDPAMARMKVRRFRAGTGLVDIEASRGRR